MKNYFFFLIITLYSYIQCNDETAVNISKRKLAGGQKVQGILRREPEDAGLLYLRFDDLPDGFETHIPSIIQVDIEDTPPSHFTHYVQTTEDRLKFKIILKYNEQVTFRPQIIISFDVDSLNETESNKVEFDPQILTTHLLNYYDMNLEQREQTLNFSSIVRIGQDFTIGCTVFASFFHQRSSLAARTLIALNLPNMLKWININYPPNVVKMYVKSHDFVRILDGLWKSNSDAEIKDEEKIEDNFELFDLSPYFFDNFQHSLIMMIIAYLLGLAFYFVLKSAEKGFYIKDPRTQKIKWTKVLAAHICNTFSWSFAITIVLAVYLHYTFFIFTSMLFGPFGSGQGIGNFIFAILNLCVILFIALHFLKVTLMARTYENALEQRKLLEEYGNELALEDQTIFRNAALAPNSPDPNKKTGQNKSYNLLENLNNQKKSRFNLNFLYGIKDQDQESYFRRYNLLSYDFKNKKPIHKCSIFLSIVRLWLYAFICSFLYPVPLAQTIMLTMINVAYFGYFMFLRPMKKEIPFYLVCLQELGIIFGTFFASILAYYDSQEEFSNINTRITEGNAVVLAQVFVQFTSLFGLTIIYIRKLKRKVDKKVADKQKQKAKIFPQEDIELANIKEKDFNEKLRKHDTPRLNNVSSILDDDFDENNAVIPQYKSKLNNQKKDGYQPFHTQNKTNQDNLSKLDDDSYYNQSPPKPGFKLMKQTTVDRGKSSMQDSSLIGIGDSRKASNITSILRGHPLLSTDNKKMISRGQSELSMDDQTPKLKKKDKQSSAESSQLSILDVLGQETTKKKIDKNKEQSDAAKSDMDKLGSNQDIEIKDTQQINILNAETNLKDKMKTLTKKKKKKKKKPTNGDATDEDGNDKAKTPNSKRTKRKKGSTASKDLVDAEGQQLEGSEDKSKTPNSKRTKRKKGSTASKDLIDGEGQPLDSDNKARTPNSKRTKRKKGSNADKDLIGGEGQSIEGADGKARTPNSKRTKRKKGSNADKDLIDGENQVVGEGNPTDRKKHRKKKNSNADKELSGDSDANRELSKENDSKVKTPNAEKKKHRKKGSNADKDLLGEEEKATTPLKKKKKKPTTPGGGGENGGSQSDADQDMQNASKPMSKKKIRPKQNEDQQGTDGTGAGGSGPGGSSPGDKQEEQKNNEELTLAEKKQELKRKLKKLQSNVQKY